MKFLKELENSTIITTVLLPGPSKTLTFSLLGSSCLLHSPSIYILLLSLSSLSNQNQYKRIYLQNPNYPISNPNIQTEMALIPRIFGQSSNVVDPFSLDLFDRFPSLAGSTAFNNETAALANTRIDWKETPKAHVFKADLPGLKKEEVKVEVEEGNVLQISGERSKEKEEKNEKWHKVERSSGKFMRRFRLPEDAKMDQIKATMENGVLTVTVPKKEVKKPKVKAIKIGG